MHHLHALHVLHQHLGLLSRLQQQLEACLQCRMRGRRLGLLACHKLEGLGELECLRRGFAVAAEELAVREAQRVMPDVIALARPGALTLAGDVVLVVALLAGRFALPPIALPDHVVRRRGERVEGLLRL